MLLTLVTAVSLQMTAAVAAAMPPASATPDTAWQQASAYDGASASYDREAEAQLLEMANAERAHVGLPALKLDNGLARAARTHAAEMASKNKLAHQFSDEASLTERIAANSVLHLNREGENVAVAPNVEEAHAGRGVEEVAHAEAVAIEGGRAGEIMGVDGDLLDGFEHRHGGLLERRGAFC